MKFTEAAIKEASATETENGAYALNTTGDACLDFFSTVGALRDAADIRLFSLFADAYHQDPLLATKTLFYARDVREGLGERETFRRLLKYCAQRHPEAVTENLDLIGVYGRYDDLYSLIDTPLENMMWKAMGKQLNEDLAADERGEAVSLLAKWIKSADSHSKKTRELGILTAQKLGYSVYEFKRIVRRLRKRIGIVESLMSAGKWDEIKYSAVPSRAMMIYRNAFGRHDGDRYNQFIQKAASGEEKINSSAVYPYNLVHSILYGWTPKEDPAIEAQWRQLPDYVNGEHNVIVVADTSGSMVGKPIEVALSLALYFAERNKGAYSGLWMSFSNHPHFHRIKGETLAQKISNFETRDWGWNTNLAAVFELILSIAEENDLDSKELPASVIIVSDMEIDQCMEDDKPFYNAIKKRYKKRGYKIPNVVFWNVNSRHSVFHADANRKGVQMCSGCSATNFKAVMQSIGMTPAEMMKSVLNSERYSEITIAQEG